MSLIARWSYTNKANIRPFLSEDAMTGVIEYGPVYEIACTWVAPIAVNAGRAAAAAGGGREDVSTLSIFTEDARPAIRDMIKPNDPTLPETEITARDAFDMSMFNDVPDYRLTA